MLGSCNTQFEKRKWICVGASGRPLLAGLCACLQFDDVLLLTGRAPLFAGMTSGSVLFGFIFFGIDNRQSWSIFDLKRESF